MWLYSGCIFCEVPFESSTRKKSDLRFRNAKACWLAYTYGHDKHTKNYIFECIQWKLIRIWIHQCQWRRSTEATFIGLVEYNNAFCDKEDGISLGLWQWYWLTEARRQNLWKLEETFTHIYNRYIGQCLSRFLFSLIGKCQPRLPTLLSKSWKII